MMRRLLQLCFLLILLFASKVHAQWTQMERPFTTQTLEYLTETQGAPEGVSKEIFQDSYGYIWLISFDGVFQYDGYTFHKYQNELLDTTSVSSRRVWDIFEDSNRNLWLATDEGINLFNRSTKTFQNYKPHNNFDALQQKYLGVAYSICQGTDQDLWVGTSSGLARFDLRTMKFVQELNFLDLELFNESSFGRNLVIRTPDNHIWSMVGDYIVETKLAENDLSKIEVGKVVPLEGQSIITDIEEMNPGQFWITSYGGLLSWHYQDTVVEKIKLPKELEGRLYSLSKIDEYSFWMIVENAGIVHLNVEDFSYWEMGFISAPNNKTFYPNANHLWRADNENLWVNSTEGLWRINIEDKGFTFKKFSSDWKSRANFITDAVKDQLGVEYISTNEGVVRLKNKERTFKIPFIRNGEELFIPARKLWVDRDNTIWASLVSANGIGVFQCAEGQNQFNEVFIDGALQKAMTEHFLQDANNVDSIWMSTINGLYHIDKSTLGFHNYKPKETFVDLPRNRIKKMLPRGVTELWFYHMGGGAVGMFDIRTKSWNRYPPDESEKFMLSGNVSDYDMQGDSIIWLATMKGLVSFHIPSKKYLFHNKKVDFSETYLLKVRVGPSGSIWILGANRLMKYNPKNSTIAEYDLSNDLGKNRIIEIFSTDSLFLGGTTGYCYLSPNMIRKDSIIPKVLITQFNVGDQPKYFDVPIEDVKEIDISSRDNVISFDFVGLHFSEPSKNQYQCMLDGFEKDYREMGSQRSIRYTNLSPGAYTFKVKASNADEVWSEAKSIGLIVHPTFTQTLGFKVLLLLLGVGILFAILENRKRQSKLRRQKQVAEESDAYKTKFLANISHEIRTPMNAIVGMSKLLEDTDQGPKQKQYTHAIRHSSENLLQVVNDLLDHSKIESGQFNFLNRPFDLDLSIKQAIQTLTFKAEEKGISLITKIEDDVPTFISGDPVRLNQVLLNVMGNAIKFTAKGEVALSVSKASEVENEVWLDFEIVDTGIGIPKNKLLTIFDSFNQADEDTFVEYGGTGLGLSIVKQLIEQQNGALDVSSKVGEGTVFNFVLPFSVVDRPIAEKAPSESFLNLSHLKVLVVDDTYFNQVLATELLKKNIKNVSIEVADNGEVAVEKVKKMDFDLILMDVRMPVMNGYDATLAIRKLADENKRHVPIIALTASAIRAQLDKCIAAGMDSYVTKPIDSEELFSAINKVTQNVL